MTPRQKIINRFKIEWALEEMEDDDVFHMILSALGYAQELLLDA